MTMKRKDYRLTVKVRNNNLLEAIERAGMAPGKELAGLAGVNYSRLNDLINMTASPLSRNTGQPFAWVDALCAYLDTPFEVLFSDAQLTPLKSNRAELAITAEQVFAIQHYRTAPTAITHDDGLGGAVVRALELLTPRENDVIRRRMGFYGEVETLDEIADRQGVTRERIRQIECKAMRKLRHPSRRGELEEFVTA